MHCLSLSIKFTQFLSFIQFSYIIMLPNRILSENAERAIIVKRLSHEWWFRKRYCNRTKTYADLEYRPFAVHYFETRIVRTRKTFNWYSHWVTFLHGGIHEYHPRAMPAKPQHKSKDKHHRLEGKRRQKIRKIPRRYNPRKRESQNKRERGGHQMRIVMHYDCKKTRSAFVQRANRHYETCEKAGERKPPRDSLVV